MKFKHSLIKNLRVFENFSKEEIYDHRKNKFLQIGRDRGFTKSSALDSTSLSYQESLSQKLLTHIAKNKLIYAGIALVFVVSLVSILN